ncbi:hypothetical protein TVAG_463590 [Trichomonas vaginalis G3]|uniref:Sulfatase N-terminal domain-containing protein n=1 Tax=Trichomonas vaginalis (strain ATCC PRA-98 / G3) TaxID=412133 RepID=A2EH31_TRIV3|nr:sulfatase family [Trichomonas vaginalis G3]EAY08079.1 hypothetical protein TVAG_463590 [Trichomonas vaginalis G3]KAI5543004.1 sulfatase family [Trichomonas vaginalis G3]|eukprot:XP_001320302.1 hypothetical protein [Trichomonas vaginalis G3]
MIDMESFETTFYTEKNGGCMDETVIPFLESLVLDENNVHFSHLKEPHIGGMSSVARTGYSLGSTFGALCGVPYMGAEGISEEKGYYVGFNCLSELLNAENYFTSATFGATYNDWGFGRIFGSHHFTKINSVYEILQSKGTFWLHDYHTFKFFKKEITNIHSLGRPFFTFLTTLDTHEPGFVCPRCPTGSKDILRAAKCTDNQLREFIEWSKTQEWYNNTVFVFYGDHISRDVVLRTYSESHNFDRKVYNVIINS